MSRLAPRSTPRVGSLSSRIRGLGGEPARDDDLLLVAAAERRDRVARAAEHDPQPLDVAREAAARSTPAAGGRRRRRDRTSRQREVLADGERAEQRLVPALARHVGDAGARSGRAGSRSSTARPSVSRTTRPAPPAPRKRVQERVLALALEPGEPDDLARVQLEVDPGPVGPQPYARRARSTTSLERGRSGRACPVSVRCSAPVISRTSSAAAASPRRRVATVSPERITVTRSPISSTSSIRCEMKIVLVPSSARRRTMANSRSRVATSSAEVASSRIRTRGSPDEGPRDAARLPVAERQLLDGPAEVGRAVPSSSPSVAAARSTRSSFDTASRCSGSIRARGCRGSTAAGRRAPPGRRRRSRGRAPPGASGSRPASAPPPRSSRGRAGGRR